MHKRVAAALGRARDWLSHARLAFAIAALLSTASVLSAPADIARGLAWLQTQIQSNGQLLQESNAASSPQAHCEAAATLIALASNSPQVAALIAAIQTGPDQATETLACVQSLRQQLGQTILNPEVEQRRVGGQGYAAYEGFGIANALDTGWALTAQLQNLSAIDKARALAWLQTSQATDGSFATNGQPDLLATAVILRGLKNEASTNSVAASVAAKAATYLLGKRNTEGHWANDVALTALVFEAVHPYSGQNAAIASGVDAYLIAQQLPNGSWQGDGYVTAVALRALALAAQPPLNPTTTGFTVKFVDARNGAALPGVSLSGTGPATIAANSGPTGQIELRGLTPGAYQLSATLSGYAPVNLSATLVAGLWSDLGAIQMLVPANPSAVVISGMVRDQDSGTALAGVTVSVDAQSLSATTGADGRYLISNVVPGALTLSASKTGYLSASGSASVQAGQVLDFSPRLTLAGAGGTSLCTIQGTVREAVSQTALAGAVIQVTGANTAAATTDASGRYSITGLSSGNVVLLASMAGYDVAQASTRLICDALRPTSVDFSPRLYSTNQSPPNANSAGLSGVVMDAGTNQPIVGAQIAVTPDAGSPKFATSQADGRFSVQGLNGASAQVEVQATGYQTLSVQYALLPLQDQDLGQLRLRKPKVEQLLPDLKVLSVKRHTAQTDAQTLQVSGAIEVQLMNAGNQTALANVAMVAFSDTNRNGQLDTGVDAVLGQTTIAPALAPGQVITLPVTVAGTLPFRDAPIHVLVDALHQVTESNTANNIASTAQHALYAPDAQQAFQPQLKWEWNASSVLAANKNVMMAPIAIPTRDTNGDGHIDANDVSDIIVTTFGGTYAALDGVVRILNGASGSEIATFSASRVHPYANLAAADLDGDGIPEIVAVGTEFHRPVAYKRDGQFLWKATQGEASATGDGGYWGGITIADLDGDGNAEVLFQRNVYDARTGALKWTASGNYAGSHPGQLRFSIPVTADLFGTGKQNLILGASVYDHLGNQLWLNSTVGDGFVAVADFNGDGVPEIVVTANGRASLLNRNGTLVWGPITLPGGAVGGGAPTIADVDGDGIPEIGVASSYRYTVLRADGTVMWSREVNDYSSGITASTAFDFLGDGKSKVLYTDEASVFVYDGATGITLLRIPSSSATTMEQPIVVDADRDGHAEFVTVRNNLVSHSGGAQGSGVRVYHDANNSWVPTRSIWNQHAYSITNINDNLSVPINPVPSWQTHNTFRLNKRIDGDPRAIADLTLSYVRVADAGAQGSTLTVRVGNGGSYKIPAGTKLAMYNADATANWPGAAARLATAATTVELQPGQHEDIAIPLAGVLSALAPTGQLWLVGDDDGTGVHAVPDFDRSNNIVAADVSAIATNLGVTVATDKASYNELDQAVFTATVSNAGSFARSPQVRLSVLDATGVLVQVLPLPTPVSVAPGSQANVPAPWSAAGVLSGNYQVLAELITPQGIVYRSATANFAVQASQSVALSASVRTDRVSYTAAQTVALSARLANLTGNTAYEGLSGTTTVTAVGGPGVFSQSETIVQLAPLGQRSYGYTLGAGTLNPGAYQAQFVVRNAQNQTVAQSSANFQVIGSEQTGIGLTGQLQATPSTAPIGSNVALQLSATHNGNAAIANTTVRVRLVNPATGDALATFSQPVAAWAVGATQNFSWSWPAAGTHGQALVAAATVEIAGNEVPLAQAPFTLSGVSRIQASSSTLDFGSQTTGSSTTRTFTITSAGSATVTYAATALSGNAASDYALVGGTCTGNMQLAPGGSCTVVVRFTPSVAGTRAAVATSTAAGSTETAVVTLNGLGTQPQPNLPLTGTLSATPASVVQGSPVQLFYNVSNPNSQPVSTTLTLSVSLENTSTVATQWSIPATIGANGSNVGNQSWTPPGAAGSRYVATLSAITGSPPASAVLATSSFTVTASPLQINASKQIGGQTRILMLVAPPLVPGRGYTWTFGVANPLKAYFAARGITAHVVTTVTEFETAMRCGNYNLYWIYAREQQLSLSAQGTREVREAVERGDGLILDSYPLSVSPLTPLLGMVPNGSGASAQTIIMAGGGIYPSGVFNIPISSASYTVQGGTIEATFANGGPAIVSSNIGRGRGLAFAFDLVSLMSNVDYASNADLTSLLQHSLQFIAGAPSTPAGVQTTVVRAPVTLQTLVGNTGQVNASVQVQAVLPLDVKIFSTQPEAVVTQAGGQTQVTWNTSLDPGQQQNFVVHTGFNSAGTIDVPVQISASGAGTSTNQTVTHTTTVLTSATAAANAVQVLAGLNPSGQAEAAAATRAKNAAAQASQWMGQARYNEALTLWTDASHDVRSITTTDTSVYKQALALAILATEREFCAQLSCLQGELDFKVNGQVTRTVPPQGTIAGSRLIRNVCSAQLSKSFSWTWANRRSASTALSPAVSLTIPANGSSFDEVNWQAQGSEGDIIDVTLTGWWMNEKFHMVRDSFVISSQASQLARLSQQASSASLPAPQLAGTLKANFRSAPAGKVVSIQRSLRNVSPLASSVQLRVRVLDTGRGDAVVKEFDQTLSVAAGEESSASFDWPVPAWVGRYLKIELIATVTGTQQVLDAIPLTIAP